MFNRRRRRMPVGDKLDIVLDLAIAIMIIILLSGCAANPPPPQLIEIPQYHPSWPLPTEVCKVDWKIVLDKGWPVIGIPYPQNLDLKACNKDKTRYIKEMTNMVCHYRPEDDTRCV